MANQSINVSLWPKADGLTKDGNVGLHFFAEKHEDV